MFYNEIFSKYKTIDQFDKECDITNEVILTLFDFVFNQKFTINLNSELNNNHNYNFLAFEYLMSSKIMERLSNQTKNYIVIEITESNQTSNEEKIKYYDNTINILENKKENYFFDYCKKDQKSLLSIYFERLFSFIPEKLLEIKYNSSNEESYLNTTETGYFHQILLKLIEVSKDSLISFLLANTKKIHKIVYLIGDSSIQESLKDIFQLFNNDYLCLEENFQFLRGYLNIIKKSFDPFILDFMLSIIQKDDFIEYLITNDANLLSLLMESFLSNTTLFYNKYKTIGELSLDLNDEILINKEVLCFSYFLGGLVNISKSIDIHNFVYSYKDDLSFLIKILIEVFCSSIGKQSAIIDSLNYNLFSVTYEQFTSADLIEGVAINQHKFGIIRSSIVKVIVNFYSLLNNSLIASMIEDIHIHTIHQSQFVNNLFLFLVDFENNNIYQNEVTQLFITITNMYYISNIVITYYLSNIDNQCFMITEKLLSSITVNSKKNYFLIPFYIPSLSEILCLLVDYSKENLIYLDNEVLYFVDLLENYIKKKFSMKLLHNDDNLEVSFIEENESNQSKSNESEGNRIDMKSNYLIMLRELYYHKKNKILEEKVNKSILSVYTSKTCNFNNTNINNSKLPLANKFKNNSKINTSSVIMNSIGIKANNNKIILNSPEKFKLENF